MRNSVIAMVIVFVSLIACQRSNRDNTDSNGNGSYMDSTAHTDELEPKRKKYEETVQPIVQIFVENSASIDGYVSGGNDLRDVIEGYMYKVRSDLNPSSIECYFVNSKRIKIGCDIREFADKITPTHFKKSGGNRGTSDMADILRQVVPNGDDTVAVLVSDFIFSPGNQDAEHYIKRQYNQINDLFSFVAQRNEWSVLIYRFEGRFNGTYYDRNDKPSKYEGLRPFYMWVIGKNDYIKKLRTLEDKPNIDIRNKCIITNGVDNINYAVQPNVGDYRISKSSNKSIEKAKLTSGKGSRKGNAKKLTIGLNVDFSKLIVNEQYLMDTSNYSTDNPAYRVVSVQESNHQLYTHTLRIETTSNNAAEVTVSLKNKMPHWIYRFNDDIGEAANPNDSIQTTYGLKKIVSGVFDAFTDNNENLCNLIISINQ